VLSGQKGAKRDAVLLNAGAGLYTVGRTKSIDDGMEMAAQAIDSGKALETLDRYVALTGAMRCRPYLTASSRTPACG